MVFQHENGEIYYIKQGEGKTPLVLIHGFPMNLHMWQNQLYEFSDRAVIAYDVGGLGKSKAGDIPCTMEKLADDLLALVDHLNLGPVCPVGLSMGGYIAMRAMEKAPEKFNAAILSNTRTSRDTDEGLLARTAMIREILTSDDLRSFARTFAANGLSPEAPIKKREVLIKMIEIILENRPKALADTLLALATRTDTSNVLKSFDKPVLFIGGAHDKLTPPEVIQEMGDNSVSGQTAIIPGAGHFSAIEKPEEFNEIVKNFLARLD